MKPLGRVQLAVLAIACGLSSPLLAGPNEDALAAHARGDNATALRLWRGLAEQGNAQAQTNLGYMYFLGHGVQKDDVEAVRWYQKAADQGDATAQCNLGFMYDKGYGVPKDKRIVPNHPPSFSISDRAALDIPVIRERHQEIAGRPVRVEIPISDRSPNFAAWPNPSLNADGRHG